MIDLSLKSGLATLEFNLKNLLDQIETNKTLTSNELNGQIISLFNNHFFNSDLFIEDYFYSYRNSTYVSIWHQGLNETQQERIWAEESTKFRQAEFIRHFLFLTPHVNSFKGKISAFKNKPAGFSNLAFYFLSKLAELESETYFHFDWILFAEGIQIGNKLKEDLKKYLSEKELIEQDLYLYYRITYSGRLFLEEKLLKHG